MKKTLSDLLENIAVMAPGQWDNEEGPKDWFAVGDDNGIIAYCGNETLALHLRLAIINSRLNSGI